MAEQSLQDGPGHPNPILAEIPFQDLPLTIQDSITIARRLGFRYIWIDALCIIQDSADDWEREAAKMHLIYQNSALTIAAFTASDSQPGILQSRSQSGQPRDNLDDTGLHTRG